MFIRPCKGRVTSPFGWRIHPISNKRAMHWGTDFASNKDNAIVAAAAGKVRLVNRGSTGYGYYLIITHSNGWETLYAHLASISVGVGATVKQGQRIGLKGTTGNSTGIHLHFEVHTGKWNNQWSNAKDPAGYINDPSITLSLGVNGPRVGDLQRKLNSVGYKLVVDESFGAATDVAVKSFQRVHKLTVDGLVGPATFKLLDAIKPKPAPKPKGKTLHLPKSQSSWRIYPTNKAPVKANALKTRLNPKKFGGLSYAIIGNPQKDVYTIKTGQLGTVNIYAGPGTGAVIK